LVTVIVDVFGVTLSPTTAPWLLSPPKLGASFDPPSPAEPSPPELLASGANPLFWLDEPHAGASAAEKRARTRATKKGKGRVMGALIMSGRDRSNVRL
jgi:hypothetical protein